MCNQDKSRKYVSYNAHALLASLGKGQACIKVFMMKNLVKIEYFNEYFNAKKLFKIDICKHTNQ